jgi:F-type H+-transporting ATPase subunit c
VGKLRGPEKPQQTKELKMITPILGVLAGNLHVGLAALGASLGVGLIGMKASEAVGRNPGAATQILVQALISTAFAEGIVFFAIYLAH